MSNKKNFLLVGGGRLATACVTLVAIRFATTFLSPEQFGQLSLLIAVQMFSSLFLISPVAQHINRHTHQWWDDGSLLSRLASFMPYVLIVALIGAVVVFGTSIQSSPKDLILASAVMFIMVVGVTWNSITIYALYMLGFRFASVIWSFLTVLSGLFVSISSVLLVSSAISWFFGQAVGMTIGAIASFLILRKHALLAGHKLSVKQLLDKHTIVVFCIPLAVSTGFMWMQIGGYRFVIEEYWGMSQLGFVAVGMTLASQVGALVESMVMQFLYPFFYRRISNNSASHGRRALSDLLNILGPIYLILAGTTVLSATFIMKILVDEKYFDAWMFVMLGAVVECCRMLGNVFGNAAQITKNTRSLAIPYAVGALVVFTTLILAGENHYGIGWIGAALLAGAFSMVFMMVFSMHREVQFSLELKPWMFGFLGMIALCIPAMWIQPPDTFLEAISYLILIVLTGCIITFGVLRKSPSLGRMLAVKLREEDRL